MKVIIYCRKSTEDARRQISSIADQRKDMLRLAESMGYEVVEVIEETGSAKKLGRPLFLQMLADIENKKADGIMCWRIDRLTRNHKEGGIIGQMLEDGEIKAIKTMEKMYTHDTNAVEFYLDLAQAIQYSKDLSKIVTARMQSKFERGEWTTKAPIGYLNNRTTRFKTEIVIDPTKAPLIQELFREYATGRYSYQELSTHMFGRGLYAGNSRKKIYQQKISEILDNTFYYGLMKWKGLEVMGTHKPLISKELYDECQEVKLGRSRPRPQKHFFPYRGVFTCAHCGCMATPEKQKTYTYYHCTNGKGICDQKKYNINENYLTEQIAEKLEKLHVDEELIELMYQSSLQDLERHTQTNSTQEQSIEKQINELKQELSALLGLRVKKEIDADEYAERKTELKNQVTELQSTLTKLQNAPNPQSTLELTKKVFLTSATAKKRFLKAKDEQKAIIVSELLSNSTVYNRKVAKIQYKSPYNIIARTPVCDDFSQMWTREDSNSRPPQCK